MQQPLSRTTLASALWPMGPARPSGLAGDGGQDASPMTASLRATVLVLAGAALLWASAKAQVPMIPVPMTMQTFVVLTLGVTLGALEEAGHTWSMCGVSTERMHLFLAPYAAEHRTGEGGGLAEEHENITVVELPLAELRDRADRNAIDDMKTLCLVQTLRLRRPELFD